MNECVKFGNIVHVGFVVRDLDDVISFLSKIFGMGPFRIVEPDFFHNYFEKKYKGQDEDFSFRFAVAPVGQIEVEVIQPIKGRTVYDDFLKKKGEGLHHVAFEVKNLDFIIRKLEQFGIKVVQSGKRLGLSWVYIELELINGLTIELIDRTK
jgi:catechol 2,3-dioxygenase-like lactoylglutathione lyase family enzyme